MRSGRMGGKSRADCLGFVNLVQFLCAVPGGCGLVHNGLPAEGVLGTECTKILSVAVKELLCCCVFLLEFCQSAKSIADGIFFHICPGIAAQLTVQRVLSHSTGQEPFSRGGIPLLE